MGLFDILFDLNFLGCFGRYWLPAGLIGLGGWLIFADISLWWGVGSIAAGIVSAIVLYQLRTTGDDL